LSVELAVTLDGADDLGEYFSSVSDRLQEVVVDNMEDIVEEGTEMARDLTPVRTGYLRSLIGYDHTGETEFQLWCMAPYAVYQEFGTSRIEAKLFMTSAWEFIVEGIGDRILGATILEG
jgi:hypothetical protein